jgi:hypothetical protein
MNLRTLSVIALSGRDFPDLDAKLSEAVRWVSLAAGEGAQLVVLPELLNRFSGNGEGNPLLKSCGEMAFDDWEAATAPLIKAAQSLKIWLTIPVLHRDAGVLYNSFFLVSPEGKPVWRYDKLSPTPSELESGVVPGEVATTYDWQGVRLGGAICFDTCFSDTFRDQVAQGVDLLLIPSQWPGGSPVSFFCRHYGVRAAVAYPAWSRIVDIDGEPVTEGGYRQESLGFGFGAPVYTATLNFDRVALFGNINQRQIIALREKYGDRIKITFDQPNCLWFLESLDPSLQESAIMEEFGLVSARNYFQNCKRQVAAARSAV